MQSCLEKVSMDARHKMEVRSDYNSNDQYSATHPDALSSKHGGSGKGKGTGHGGHSFWVPDCNGQLGVFNYSNFDTDPSSGAGSDADNQAREQAMARSVYNANTPYSAQIIDTSASLREGQYRVP